MVLTRVSGSGDWSALYIDGKLDIANDHSVIDDRISELVGVTNLDTDDFIGDDNLPLETLEEVMDAIRQREEREDHARRLFKTAADFNEQARKLLGGWS